LKPLVEKPAELSCSLPEMRLFRIANCLRTFVGSGFNRKPKDGPFGQIMRRKANSTTPNVRVGSPLLSRLWRLANVGASKKNHSREMIKRLRSGANGARVLRERLAYPKRTAEGIHGIDEHCEGQGYPTGLRGTEFSPRSLRECAEESAFLDWVRPAREEWQIR
jgi:hypothetical protein